MFMNNWFYFSVTNTGIWFDSACTHKGIYTASFPECFLKEEEEEKKKKNYYLCHSSGFWYIWMCILNLIRGSHSKRPSSEPADSKDGVSVLTRQHQTFLTEGLPHPLVVEASDSSCWGPRLRVVASQGSACRRTWPGRSELTIVLGNTCHVSTRLWSPAPQLF